MLPTNVLGMVLKEAGPAGGMGVAGALAPSRLVQSQLFGVKLADPAIFVGAAVLLACVAFAAAMIPGRLASRIEPASALKHE